MKCIKMLKQQAWDMLSSSEDKAGNKQVNKVYFVIKGVGSMEVFQGYGQILWITITKWITRIFSTSFSHTKISKS